jgi:hypothetical protein
MTNGGDANLGAPATWGVMALYDWRKPRSAEEAHALAASAALLRAQARDAALPDIEQLADEQTVAATAFLALPAGSEPTAAGGGELVLAADGNGSARLVDTLAHPDRTSALASAERLHLAADAHALELSVDMAETIQPRDSVERCLAHQMAAAHRLYMRLAERVNRELDHLPPGTLESGKGAELARLVNAQCRLAEAFQRGALTLAKKRQGNQQTVNVVHQHVQIAGGTVAMAAQVMGERSKGTDRPEGRGHE